METSARKNLHERRVLSIINTRRLLVAALYQLEEAAKYPDLTSNDARRHLRNVKNDVAEAGLMANFAIED